MISRRYHLPHFGNTGSGRAPIGLQKPLSDRLKTKSCRRDDAPVANATRHINPGSGHRVFANCATEMKEGCARTGA
jgi:hypothetical protein